jgi:hypothetical protein
MRLSAAPRPRVVTWLSAWLLLCSARAVEVSPQVAAECAKSAIAIAQSRCAPGACTCRLLDWQPPDGLTTSRRGLQVLASSRKHRAVGQMRRAHHVQRAADVRQCLSNGGSTGACNEPPFHHPTEQNPVCQDCTSAHHSTTTRPLYSSAHPHPNPPCKQASV